VTEGVEQDPLGDSVAAAAMMAAIGLVDAFLVYIEATAAYKAKLEAAGFSPTAAETMALDFHRALMFKGVFQGGV
jgi:hypothetical protein